MLSRYLLLSFALLLFNTKANAQIDTIKILSYNTLNYDEVSGSCPDNLNYKKYKYMRDIFKYTDPDIIGLEKMNLVPIFVEDSIPAFVLDSLCNGCWDHSTLTYNSGYGKCNLLYFKKSKFGMSSTKSIYSADGNISDIDLIQLYYKDSSLLTTKDTIFLNIIIVHDKSGGSSSSQRGTEISGAMAWLDAHIHKLTNYIFMGDFNVTGSAEPCFQAMIAPANKNLDFNEPTGALGSWSSFPSNFGKYLTQSTRTADLPDCGASGGITNWFDHILCSDFIMKGTDAFTYVPNSFTVIGQDGNHVNKAIIDPPTNTSAPAYIINDIYHMSEHFPISLQLAINPAHRYVGIEEVNKASEIENIAVNYYNGRLNIINNNQDLVGKEAHLEIYNLLGKNLFDKKIKIDNSASSIDISFLPEGCYVIVLQDGNSYVSRSKIVKTDY